MKKIIFFLILIFIASMTSCDDSGSEDNGTHGKEKPFFVLGSLTSSGFVKKDKPLKIRFIIDENTVKGDKPYHFFWDFGDGTEVKEDNELSQIHEYKKQGIFKVKVTLRDNDFVSKEKTPDEEFIQELTVIAKSKVDLSVQSVDIDKVLFRNNAEGGDEGNLSVRIANLGSDSMDDVAKIRVYLSNDKKIDDNDLILVEKEFEPLNMGASSLIESKIRIDSQVVPDTYWLLFKVDCDNRYIEADEANNTYVFNTPIDVLGAGSNSPDLTFDTVELPRYFIVNDQFKMIVNIANIGNSASLPFSYKLILSEDDILDDEETPEELKNDIILKYDSVNESILPGDILPVTVKSSIPKLGDFYLFFILDSTNDIPELDEENNIYISEKITVGETLSGVDLMPVSPQITPLTGITKGRTLSVTYTVKNRGDHPAFKTKARVFISHDEEFDEDDILLPLEGGDDGEISPIAGGASLERTHRVKIPEDEDFEAGDYHLLIEVNYPDTDQRPVEEVDYGNNIVSSRRFKVEGAGAGCSKDIVVENVQVLPMPAFEGSPFTLKFEISNKGNEEVASFVTKIYTGLPDTEIEDDNYLRKNYNFSRLAPHTTLTKKITLDIPNHLSAERYCVMIKADATNTIGECDEENNIVNYCFDVMVRGNDNDIEVSDITVDKETVNLEEDAQLNIGFKVRNLGTTNTATFYCQAYFSPDDEFSANDFKVTKNYTVYNVAGGEELSVDDYQVTVPDNMGNRSYRLFVKCDDTGLVPETNEDNNVVSLGEKIKIKGSVSGCDNDIYEENSSHENASLIDLSGNVNARICDQDIDWYKFEMLKTHKFRIEMQQGYADKDIDLTLYKEAENGDLLEIMTSDSTDKTEIIEKNILTEEDEGVYYLKVYPKNYENMTQTDYTLKVSYNEVGGDGVDLVLKDVEANDINNIMTGEDFNLKFKIENLKSNPSGNFVIGIFLSSDQDISDDDTVISILNSNSLGLLETKTFENTLRLGDDLPSGQYYFIVKIDPYDLLQEIDKTNNTFKKQVMVNYNSSCEIDALEPNSWEPLQGKVVSNGTYPGLKLCKDDADVYLVYLETGDTFHADILFSDDEGDIEVRLYEPGNPTYSGSVASSTTSTDNETITYTAEETGFYILRVYKSSWGGGIDPQTYSMELSGITQGYNFINEYFQIVSSQLASDENVFFKYKLTSESTKNLTSEMKYKIYLSTDPLLSEDDRVIYTLNIDDFPFGSSISNRVKVRLPSNLDTGNYYFISKVDSDDEIEELKENDNIQIKVATVVGTCRDDIFESNNSMLEADRNDSIVSQGTYENLTICPADRDYYKIFLQAGKEVFVNIYFINAIGDLDLMFYGPNGDLLAESSSETDNEHIRYFVENSGWYYIRVDGIEYDTNAYNLEILISSCQGVECNNGSCVIDDHGITSCECDEGYQGAVCNECSDGYHENDNGDCEIDEVCDENSCRDEFKNVCSVSHGYVICSCNEGYFENDNGNCIINCDAEANLEPNAENNACVCKNGYHKNEENNCVEDETCDPNPCTDEHKTICNIVNGIAQCSCDEGYHLDNNNNCIAD